MNDPPQPVRLTLTPLQGKAWPVPPAVRLRGLLKYALRVCGWRLVEMEPLPPAAKPAPGGGAGGAVRQGSYLDRKTA